MFSDFQYLSNEEFSWFLNDSFCLKPEKVKSFYRVSFTRFYYQFMKYFYTTDDFEDVFQESIYKLFVWSKIEEPLTNKHAFFRLLTTFKNTSIDLYRKRRRHPFREVIFETFKLIDDNESVFTKGLEEEIELRQLFAIVDERIEHNPKLMSKTQRLFYTNYKSAILSYGSDHDIMCEVMMHMDISESYFGKLKSELFSKFKKIFKR